jgi:hypothetical protein
MNNQIKGPSTYDLSDFTLSDVTRCGRALRTINMGALSMEDAAGRCVRYLYDTLLDKQTGNPACSLIRFFKTLAYRNLNEELKTFANNSLGSSTSLSGMKCLTLLGTVGENEEWNLRGSSKQHKAIPLPSKEVVYQIPMIKNLIKQLGLSINSVIKPDPALLLDIEQKTYGVFYIPKALGSPYIPAQKEFVVPYGIKSVLGFGGMLPSLDIFVIIMFLKIFISRETADLFKNVALNVKLAVMPFERTVFTQPGQITDKR